jgi:hypothetical protein
MMAGMTPSGHIGRTGGNAPTREETDWLLSGQSLMAAHGLVDQLDFPAMVGDRLHALLRSDDFDTVFRQCATAVVRLFGPSEEAQEALGRLLYRLDDPSGTAILALQLCCAALTRRWYAADGVADDIYLATMGWFPRFVRWQLRAGPLPVFAEEGWAPRLLSASIVRLDQFEFEFVGGDHPFISLHIPDDAVLEPGPMAHSVRLCRAFVDRYVPSLHGCPIRCWSWLLFPALARLLPPTSRIRRFQRFFTIDGLFYSTDYKKWIAGREDIGDVDLPRSTSLQRAVRTYVCGGGRLGIGAGTLEERLLLADSPLPAMDKTEGGGR